MSCEDCCRRCCYSTPYSTLCGLVVVIVGVIGFIASAVYGIVIMAGTEPLNQHTVYFGPVAGGALLLTFFPILFSTIMAYCVTGYIRDELFSSIVKNFIGKCCSFCAMCMNFSVLILWIFVTLSLSALLTVFVLLKLNCDDLAITDTTFLTSLDCLPSTNETFLAQVCGEDLRSLCNEGIDIGIAFVAALAFTILIILGIVITLMVQGANYINARENMEYRRSYQPRNNGSEYMLK